MTGLHLRENASKCFSKCFGSRGRHNYNVADTDDLDVILESFGDPFSPVPRVDVEDSERHDTLMAMMDAMDEEAALGLSGVSAFAVNTEVLSPEASGAYTYGQLGNMKDTSPARWRPNHTREETLEDTEAQATEGF